MKPRLELMIIDPAELENLAVDICLGYDEIGGLNGEQKIPAVELYRRSGGEPWRV